MTETLIVIPLLHNDIRPAAQDNATVRFTSATELSVMPTSDRHNQHRRHAGFTIVELMVVVSIIALLIAIMFPTMDRAFEASRRVVCCSNLRQIDFGMLGYTEDYGRVFPPHRGVNMNTEPNWPQLVAKYAPGEQLARCPNLKGMQKDFGVEWEWKYDFNNIGYGYNGFFLGHWYHGHGDPDTGNWSEGTYINAKPWEKLSRVKQPAKCISFGDSSPKTSGGVNYGVSLTLWWPYINKYQEEVNGTRHKNAGVVSFVDGHAEVILDPDATINPKADNTDEFIEYWDPQVRLKP